MHLIEEGRDFLNLVEGDPAPCRPFADQGLESVRVPGELQKERGIKQVEAKGFRQNLLQPRALACPPWAEQEERSIGSLQQAGDREVMFHCNMTTLL
jgi:hypothetical protein